MGAQSVEASAQALLDRGSYAEAARVAQREVQSAAGEHGADSLEVARACDLAVQALWRAGRAGEPTALALAERALTTKTARLGPAGRELADTLVEMARVQEYVGRPWDGMRSLERALELHGERSHTTAGGLRAVTELGRMERVLGRFAEADRRLRRALEAARAGFGGDHPLTAAALHELGCLEYDLNRYPEAQRHLEEALSTRERALGPDHPLLVETLNALAWTVRVLEDTDTGGSLLERSLGIGSRRLGSSHPLVAQTLDWIGMLSWYLGNGGEMEAYDRARPVFESAARSGYWEAGVWMGHEGMVVWWNQRQDFLTALRMYEAAVELLERTLGPDHPRLAWALGGLCGGLHATGQDGAAKACDQRRTALLRRILARGDAPPRLEVEALLMEAGRLGSLGLAKEARDVMARVLEIQLSLYGPFNNSVAWTHLHMAGLSRALGDLEEARASVEAARLSWEGAWGERPSIPVFEALGSLAEADGDLAEARRQYELAMQVALESLGAAHPAVGPVLIAFADRLLRIGEAEESFDVALQGERRIRTHLRLTIPSLSEREGLRYAAAWASGLDVVLSIAAADPRPGFADEAHDALIRSRALVLDEIATRQQLAWGAGDPTTVSLASRLAGARSRLAEALVRPATTDEPESYGRLVDEVRREKERLERELAKRSQVFRAGLSDARADLGSVREALQAGEALISYARYTFKPAGTSVRPDREPAGPAPAYVAFVLAGGRSSSVPLGDAEVIDARVRELREGIAGLAESGGRSSRREERRYREIGEALRSLIWDPIAPHFGGATRLFVVPDGALSFVSLAALPAGSDGFLVETGRVIHYLAAERDLLRTDAPSAGRGLLAMGDPSFDSVEPPVALRVLEGETVVAARDPFSDGQRVFRGSRSACGALRTLRFDPLPASSVEVAEVARSWSGLQGAIDPSARNAGVALLTGSSATEAAFKARAPGHRVVHLATHGFFLGGDCSSALDRPAALGSDGLPAEVVGENPLLLSGLVLAGANHREDAGPEEDDGILTAEEIASLDLSGVEWAVLSACDTGVGEVRAGEGVFGLRRAFQVAGARTLIMSLWPVDDEATRAWMRGLYTNRFVEGMSTVDSVHGASLALLRERREKGLSTHPFHWAGFIASGDWR